MTQAEKKRNMNLFLSPRSHFSVFQRLHKFRNSEKANVCSSIVVQVFRAGDKQQVRELTCAATESHRSNPSCGLQVDCSLFRSAFWG